MIDDAARLRKTREALHEAIELIEGLAQQQAMQDDWYVPKLEELKEILNA